MTTYNKNNRVPSYALYGVPEQEAYGGVPTDEAYCSGLDNGMYQFEKDRLADEQALHNTIKSNMLSILSNDEQTLLFNDMEKEIIDRVTPHLFEEEKPKAHTYLDTTWNRTVGVGANVNNWNDFKNVKWEVGIGGRTATEEEIYNAYHSFDEDIANGLKKLDNEGNMIKNNFKADTYTGYSNLRINDKEQERLLKNHLVNDIQYLRKEFADFDSFPPELQDVLVDIKFNTGNVAEESWPNLRKAIAQKDLIAIGNNVNRKDVSVKRNNWAREKIANIKSW